MADLWKDLSKVANKSWKMGKDYALGTPEIEIKVREATSNEPWGPTTAEMQQLAQSTFNYADLPIIMNTLWRRMADTGKDWRHVYKSLIVLDFFIKHGSDQALREMRYHVVDLQNLTGFQYMDENYQDVGQSVRERAKKVLELLHDERRMKEERTKAQQNRSKYQGYGSDSSMRGGPRTGPGYDYDRPSYGGETDPYGYRARGSSPYGGRREGGDGYTGGSPYGGSSPYGGRREGGLGGSGGGGSGSRSRATADLSDSDSDSEFELPASRTARPSGGASTATASSGGSALPRRPSVDNGSSSGSGGGATFDPFGQLAATHAVPPVASSASSASSSPFFPAFESTPVTAHGNGSSSSGSTALPSNLFDSPTMTSTPPPAAAMGPPLGVQMGGPSLFPPAAGGSQRPPQQQGPVEAEWDAFVGFDDPRKQHKEENQNDLWNKHKNLFDLQHLSLSEKEAAAAAAAGAQKRPMATMTSAAGRGRGAAGAPATATAGSPRPAAGPTMMPIAPATGMGSGAAYPTSMVATPYGMPYGAGATTVGAMGAYPAGMVVGYAPGVPGMVPVGYTTAGAAPAPFGSAPIPGVPTAAASRPGGAAPAAGASSSSNGVSLLF